MRLKIRCDGECEKFCKIFRELNKALVPLHHLKSKNFLKFLVTLNLTVHTWSTKALFRCEKILDFATVAFSFVYDKYYSIMN